MSRRPSLFDILARLDEHRHGTKWRAACPAHWGDNPTALAIARGDGQPLLYCHAHGCSYQDILRALGLEANGTDHTCRPRSNPQTEAEQIILALAVSEILGLGKPSPRLIN
jgi:hypothetical protein